MRPAYLLIGLALAAALVISLVYQPMAVEERLVRIQAREALPQLHGLLEQQPVELQAVLLDYADDEVLLLKARVALLKHPAIAREVFALYGAEPEFREILAAHGESILLPLQYFLNNEIRSVALMHYTALRVQALQRTAQRLWGSDHGAPPGPADAAGQSQQPEQTSGLTPEQRGWYAVNFIRDEGHDFLGQFVMDPQGNVSWVQTERLLEGGNAFFASGFRTLERKYHTSQTIDAADYGWAALDAVVVSGAVKLLRAGRVAAGSTRSAGLAGRSSVFAARLGRVGQVGRVGLQAGRYARWPVAIAGAYMVFRHPGLVSDVLSGVAAVLGLPVWLVQVVGWMLILLPLFWLASLLGRLVLRPSIRLLRGLALLLYRLERNSRRPARRLFAGKSA